MKRTVIWLLCLFLLQQCSVAPAQTGERQELKPFVIRARRLLDVRTGAVITNAVILVEGAKIKAVGSDLPIPSGAQVTDLGDLTVLPGLIDCHTHLLQNYNADVGGDDPNMILTVTQMGTAKRALLGAAMGREMLEAGFTMARDLGNSGVNGDVALRDAINAGWVVGPRLRVSTRALAPLSGQFGSLSSETQQIIEQEYVRIGGVEDARRAVRQALYDGADWIKVIINNGRLVLSLEEVKAIVEEAHRLGRPVAAHATDEQSTRIAVEAGVDSIEHAYEVSEETLKRMAEKNIFLVPTDGPMESYLLSSTLPPAQREQAGERVKPFLERSRKRLARAIKMGVPIAAGSDAYFQQPNKTRGQASIGMFRAYAEAGMTPIEIIRSATIKAAELLGWHDRVGSIEANYLADLIAVEGNPLTDITALERVKLVMKGGQIVKDGRMRKVAVVPSRIGTAVWRLRAAMFVQRHCRGG